MLIKCLWIVSALAIFNVFQFVYGKPKNKVDTTITEFAFNRICWWNESCKEEFSMIFKCKCPKHLNCRSHGKYYNAFCDDIATGYVWDQGT